MTAQQAILSLGTVTLAGCGAGLVLIHDSNPLLKGLNWMGTALVVGGLVTGLTLASGSFPWMGPLANTCVLLAFLCCYRAERYLVGADARRSAMETVLTGLQIATVLMQWSGIWHAWQGTAVVSILAAVQMEAIARLIQRSTVAKGRTAARLTVGLTRLLAAANLVRGGCAAGGLLTRSGWAEPLNLLTYNILVASALGLAFAFFWRTTAKLSLDLEHMASTDPLTRVYNRRIFLNWCESEQSRSRRLNVPFSVLMVDFDHFKRVNDTFGHHAGDQVLCAAVERIQDSIRGIDVLCRWGGEEFAVLLPSASAEATALVAERVRRNVMLTTALDLRFTKQGVTGLQVSASIGTATYDGAGDSFDLMLQRADSALYEAKRAGRNRVILSRQPSEIEVGVESLGRELAFEPS